MGKKSNKDTYSRRGGKFQRFCLKVERLFFRCRCNYWVNARHVNRDDVICFQMCKVGSSTVVKSLVHAFYQWGIDVKVHHIHELARLEGREEELKSERVCPEDMIEHIGLCKSLRDKVIANPDKKWKLISMVRDPISRNVSEFFYTLDAFVPDWVERYKSGELDTDKLLEMFLEAQKHDKTDVWYDQQMKEFFGIDVFSTPFPKTKGYKIYNDSKGTPLLLIRLEDLNKCAKKTMVEFLGLRCFTLIKTNIADEKVYSEIYRDFKKNVCLPDEYITKMCSSKYARFFYTDEELKKIAIQWGSVQ